MGGRVISKERKQSRCDRKMRVAYNKQTRQVEMGKKKVTMFNIVYNWKEARKRAREWSVVART